MHAGLLALIFLFTPHTFALTSTQVHQTVTHKLDILLRQRQLTLIPESIDIKPSHGPDQHRLILNQTVMTKSMWIPDPLPMLVEFQVMEGPTGYTHALIRPCPSEGCSIPFERRFEAAELTDIKDGKKFILNLGNLDHLSDPLKDQPQLDLHLRDKK